MAPPRSKRGCQSDTGKSIINKKTLHSRLKAVLSSLSSVFATASSSRAVQRIELASSKCTVMSGGSTSSRPRRPHHRHRQDVARASIQLASPQRGSTSPTTDADFFMAVPCSRRCIFDINIRVAPQQGQGIGGDEGFGGKVAMRVLLDTGADLNMIAGSAHRDVGTPIDLRCAKFVSLGGSTALHGRTELTFDFLGTTSLPATKNMYTDIFAVSDPHQMSKCDCILGAHWILRYWHDFTQLMASRVCDF